MKVDVKNMSLNVATWSGPTMPKIAWWLASSFRSILTSMSLARNLQHHIFSKESKKILSVICLIISF